MSNYTMSPVVNGKKKQMIVKVGDTLPIGTEVDYEGAEVPNGWEQVSDPNEYSTTEQVVGKWIDGKPIYRKVIESTTFTTDYYYIGLDVKGFVNQYGWVQRKDYPRLWQYIPSRVGDPMSISFLATDTSQGVKIDWGSNWQSQYATIFNKIVIVVEYTKTTD